MAVRAIDDVLSAHRAKTQRAHRVRNSTQLVALVDALGFCFAFSGEAAYPVPAAFDHLSTSDDGKKWEWMWPWKDELPEAKKLYYGKLLVKKPTFVSMQMLPLFYATFGRAGETDDHVDDVRAGRLTDLAKRVVEYLAHRGETQKKRMRADLVRHFPGGDHPTQLGSDLQEFDQRQAAREPGESALCAAGRFYMSRPSEQALLR